MLPEKQWNSRGGFVFLGADVIGLGGPDPEATSVMIGSVPCWNVSFVEQNVTSRTATCALGASPFSQPCSHTTAGGLSLLQLIFPEGSLTPSSAHPAIKATQMRLQDRELFHPEGDP